MKFKEWLSQQVGVIEVDCGCVTAEAFYHWLRVAYESGTLTNEGTIQVSASMPDSELTDDVLDDIIAGAKTSMEQYLSLSFKSERAASQSGNSGQHVTVPDGYVLVPVEPTQEMVWAAKNVLKHTV